MDKQDLWLIVVCATVGLIIGFAHEFFKTDDEELESEENYEEDSEEFEIGEYDDLPPSVH